MDTEQKTQDRDPILAPIETTHIQLGFDRVRELIAKESHSEPIHQKLLELIPLAMVSEMKIRLQKIGALWEFWRSSAPFPMRHFEDLAVVLKTLKAPGALLSIEGFQILRPILEQFRLLNQYFETRVTPENSWWNWLKTMAPQQRLETAIDRVIAPEGYVLDHASPELRKIRNAIQRTEAAVRKQMDALITFYSAKGMLTDDRPTIKAGRLVLPVSSNAKRQVKGVIQDQSHTGNTTYVEPLEIIDLNNKIRSLQADEIREIERILRALTTECHTEAWAIGESYQALLELDFIASLARFGQKFHGSLPVLENTNGFKLNNARNPLLSETREIVPLNLNLPKNTHTLVITGPNAGGKTVALKTVGLMVLLARCGAPVIADDGCQIPWVDAVYSDIGDQQSILNDLSTFSAHMTALVGITENATSQSLVLLDELGTGTDPAEGSALARAVLNTLTKRGITTIATTHLGELKVFAHETPGVANASMDFDSERLEPTYRLRQGIPGSSYGLEISRRLGLAQEILDEAKSYIGDKRGSLEELIANLEQRLQEAEKAKEETRRLESLMRSRENEIEANLKEIRKAHKTAKRDAAREAQVLIADARKTAERLIRELREGQADTAHIQEVRVNLQRQSKAMAELAEVEIPLAEMPLDRSAVADGLTVRVVALGQTGTVLGKIGRNDRVLVDFGDKRMQVPLEWLSPLDAKKRTDSDEDNGKVVVTMAGDRHFSSTLDMRGMRFEEAEVALLRFLDQSVLANLTRVDIIHGKGTGALKQLVQDLLKNHKSVKEFHLGGLDEGGAGITLVTLR